MAQGIKSNISKEELEELLKTNTLKEIAEKLKVSLTTVKRYKTKYNLQINQEIALQKNIQSHTKYECDIHYFDKIDNMNKAYLLGFICADGFITHRNEIGIGLQKLDKDMIVFFKKELKSNKPIIEKDGSYKLRIQNKYLADAIQKYEIIPNKSLVLNIENVIKLAELNDKQIKAFLLGYYDGDGGIYNYSVENNTPQWSMNITGTIETCNYYKNYFEDGFLTKRHKDNKNNYTFQIGGCNKVEKALNKLYEIKNELNFYYNRKYEKYKKLCQYNRR